MNSSKLWLSFFLSILLHLFLILYFTTAPDIVLLFSIGFALQYVFMLMLSFGIIIKASDFNSVTQLSDAINQFSLIVFKYIGLTFGIYILSRVIQLLYPNIGDTLATISIFIIGIVLVFFIPSLSVLSIKAIYLGIRHK